MQNEEDDRILPVSNSYRRCSADFLLHIIDHLYRKQKKSLFLLRGEKLSDNGPRRLVPPTWFLYLYPWFFHVVASQQNQQG